MEENLSKPVKSWADRLLETGLTYDDVTLAPQNSPVSSRSEVDTSTRIVPSLEAESPVITSPMDTITEEEMAIAIWEAGGIGIIHRFNSPDEQADMVASIEVPVGGSVGINDGWRERAEKLVRADVDFLCLDVAHGHLDDAIDVLEELSSNYDLDIMAGNVVTPEAAIDLYEAGADSIKVGIGPGSHCTTREVAGVGIPQFTAVLAVCLTLEEYDVRDEVTVVADGGITQSGDIVKALMAGADSVMVGSLVGGCEEAPAETVEYDGKKYKKTRGMASEEAKQNRHVDGGEAVEGSEALTEYTGNVSEVIERVNKGIRSGLSYCGGYDIEEARESIREAEEKGVMPGYIKVTSHTELRNGVHGVNQREVSEDEIE